MAWIESHQDLATNPKTKRAARLLDVSVPQVIGHLHMLWWWTLDHAFDGDLSEFDALDVAEAAGWDGDPDGFVTALIECGPGGKAGFLDAEWTVHDWDQFTEHLRVRREASAAAHHKRWHVNRGVVDPACDLCEQNAGTAPADAPHSGPDAAAMRTHDNRSAPTGTGTGTDQTPLPLDSGEDEAAQQFEEHFWPTYPPTNGRKPEKAKALQQWRKLTVDQRRRALIGARNLAKSDSVPKYAHRFLRHDTAGEFPFDDWQTSASASARAGPSVPVVGSAEWEAAQQRQRERSLELVEGGR